MSPGPPSRGLVSLASVKRPRKGALCSSACVTRDHYSWGECVRNKGLQLSPHVNGEYGSRQKAWDKELDLADSAVRQGIDIPSTKTKAVQAAIEAADSG